MCNHKTFRPEELEDDISDSDESLVAPIQFVNNDLEMDSDESYESAAEEEEEEEEDEDKEEEEKEETKTEEKEEEEEEEDELVQAIRKQRQNLRELPRDIVSKEYVVQISFHPQEHTIALATIAGDVLLYKYCDDTDAELLRKVELHTRACRDMEFSEEGTSLFSVSKDKSMMVTDVETGKLKQAYEDAHADPLFCLRIINNNQVATGDDFGTVKLWDVRTQREIFSLKEANDFISAMITTDAQRHLACTSGEGAITVLNLGQRKLHMQSEMYENDLNCLGLCRADSKLVAGTGDGKLLLFNWGEFAYHSDEFPGPEHGINRLIAATDNIIITACDDGNLRATYLFPHRHLGVIGQHPFAVESLDISGDGRLIASCAHDQTVKFWNIKYLEDVQVNGKVKADKNKRAHNLPSSRFNNASDFFQGLGTSGQ